MKTSISPSVYVAFQSLQAIDICGHVGTLLPETTIAFLPNELSTSQSLFSVDTEPGEPTEPPYESPYVWSQFNFEDLQ
jgi:hypothetical protein